MNRVWRKLAFIAAVATIFLVLTACTTATSSEGPAEGGKEAFVDGVSITEAQQHFYATVDGHYPDACARVSDVQQTVEGSDITIKLFVASPQDMMCAQMLTPFVVDILLETGGLAPGEYTVTVNDGRTATFTVGG